jgi:hypothetical protein
LTFSVFPHLLDCANRSCPRWTSGHRNIDHAAKRFTRCAALWEVHNGLQDAETVPGERVRIDLRPKFTIRDTFVQQTREDLPLPCNASKRCRFFPPRRGLPTRHCFAITGNRPAAVTLWPGCL